MGDVKPRAVGVDPGRRRVGLALADDGEGTLALPFRTIERGGDDVEAAVHVARAIREGLGAHPLAALVIGLPLRMDGSEGEAARRARRFGDELAKRLEVEPLYRDERFTTVAAERGLRELGTRARDQHAVVDQSAAALLLQGYLDAQR